MLYKVMLADDEPIMRKALLTLTDWEAIGCEIVYSAANGQEVLDNLEQTAPDILIVDIRMPGKNGIEVAQYVWEHKLPVKIIILTAYADFSYAQAAVKYGVAEYVTKTGMFEELISAVERTKEKVKQERRDSVQGGRPVKIENLFKAVFDGSLYEPEEICENFAGLDIRLARYMILLLRFRITEERGKKDVKTINRSLSNFFHMVFGTHMMQAIPVERDMFVVVLKNLPENYAGFIAGQCEQIIDTMDNFMNLYVCVGISEAHREPEQLRAAYDEAETALGYSFIDEKSKINYYVREKESVETYPLESEKMIQRICDEIAGGSARTAEALLEELFAYQKSTHCSAHMVKNMGIQLQNRCRGILSEYEKTIYEVTGITGSISRSIYNCRHMADYESMMRTIVIHTARSVHITANKKQSLIHECQKYIDENYEKNIMVTDIAREIGASPSYLSRIFKEMTGQTIIATLNQKKLEKAKEYLRKTDRKIYEVAELLGFENTTYFSHFFKKYTGVSPKDYQGE